MAVRSGRMQKTERYHLSQQHGAETRAGFSVVARRCESPKKLQFLRAAFCLLRLHRETLYETGLDWVAFTQLVEPECG